MPLPFLFMGIAAATAAIGVGKTVVAISDTSDANYLNKKAERISTLASDTANKSRQLSGDAVTELGRQKLFVLDHSMNAFLASFQKLHNVDLSRSKGLKEMKNFRITQKGLHELEEMSSLASSMLAGAVSGLGVGAITAFGATAGVSAFACASTGAAISGLSGAAATNATLAFLGGGSLAAGGLGMAGGTAVLGGLVAGPALAVMGFVIGAKANENLDNAKENIAEAQKFEEEMRTVCTLCDGIRSRATLFQRQLLKLNALFEPLIYQLENTIAHSGTDFSTYNTQERQCVAAALSLAGAIKAMLDTAILTEDGVLTEESARMAETTQKFIEAHR